MHYSLFHPLRKCDWNQYFNDKKTKKLHEESINSTSFEIYEENCLSLINNTQQVWKSFERMRKKKERKKIVSQETF